MEIATYSLQVTALALHGRLDAAQVNRIRQDLKDLTRSGQRYFVVNLRDVSFIDSQGLGVLISLLRAARALDGDVRFVEPTVPAVQQLLEVTKLRQAVQFFTTLEKAVGSFHINTE
jgi:anti-sigma B factor antagonist